MLLTQHRIVVSVLFVSLLEFVMGQTAMESFNVIPSATRCDPAAIAQRAPRFSLGGGGHTQVACAQACLDQSTASCVVFVYTVSGFCHMFQSCDVTISVTSSFVLAERLLTTSTTVSTVTTSTTTTNIPINLTAPSLTSCNEFGWRNSTALPLVCGESEVASALFGGATRCHGAEQWTFDDAVSVCHTIGARLCTLSEIVLGVVQGTGCNVDREQTWSSTECELPDTSVGYITLPRYG